MTRRRSTVHRATLSQFRTSRHRQQGQRWAVGWNAGPSNAETATSRSGPLWAGVRRTLRQIAPSWPTSLTARLFELLFDRDQLDKAPP